MVAKKYQQMKTHTTNYFNTFIEIAEDSPVKKGVIPPVKNDEKSIARLQYEMLNENPYKFESDDVLFSVFAKRKAFSKNELDEQRAAFFSKGQPCFRASPLTKTYGWGIHSDEQGKIAMYSAESQEYKNFIKDPSIKKLKAMRSKKS
jgi:hypothetical protein